ncbi:MAG: chemotaxis protein MotB [Ilumatobacteraceae bacterium]|nr:chemotaxis protein MotB [Ilumatobacteraceae bacterium]
MTRSRRGRGGHGGGGGGGGHGGGDARWLVTYADLLTLLMVLFLVLWVISTIDAKKFEKFKAGLGDFGNPAAVADAKGETQVINQSPNTAGEFNSTTTTVVGGTAPVAPDPATPGTVLDTAQLSNLVEGLQNAVDAAGLGGVVMVHMDERGLVISVSTDDVLFQSASAVLGPEATQIIGLIAPDLAGIGNNVVVEGYTDKRPLHRQGYDNWDLSVDRAVSVLKLLRDTPGVDAARLSAAGYGDQHPIDSGDTEAAYAKNRRVEIIVVANSLITGATPVTETTTANA